MKRTRTWKDKEVESLKTLLSQYSVIGVADMTAMPSLQLQRVRDDLRGKVAVRMSKGRILKLVFSELSSQIKGLDTLAKYIRGMPALILTNDSPFKLAATLKKSKSKAPAKANQVAPNDIYVEEGATSFAPGPVIGELGALGIKTAIENGKIAIKAKKKVVSEGEVISSQVASILSRLGIEPMEIGINLLATVEDGDVLTKDVLFVDEQEYLDNIQRAAQEAFNLAYNVAWPIPETIELLVKKAQVEALALSKKTGIHTKETVGGSLAQASAEGDALKGKVGDLPEKQEVKAEAPKVEEQSPVEEVKAETKEVPEEKKEEVPEKTSDAQEASVKSGVEAEAEAAQNVLKKLQDDKLQSFKAEKPDEPKIQKGPSVSDLVGDN